MMKQIGSTALLLTFGITIIVLILIGIFYFKSSNTEPSSIQTSSPTSPTPASDTYPTTPNALLKTMIDTQLDCLNTVDASGMPSSPVGSSQSCIDKTNIYVLNNQPISVGCSPQNFPAKDQVEIDPAIINGQTASALVHTFWADGDQDTPAKAELTFINQQWKVVSISCHQ